MKLPRLLFCIWSILALAVPLSRGEGFTFDDKPGDHLDVLLDGKIVARYMDAHDNSTPERRDETYKPYLHVFDAEGIAPITQGAGGKLFPHHRGIYIGWNKITFDGKSFDRWHMREGRTVEKKKVDQHGAIVHDKFIDQKVDANAASFTSLTHWEGDPGGKPIVEEERAIAIRKGTGPWRLMIDFTSKLSAPNGEVKLDGDPEHAGIQYRPAGDVAVKETVYLYPVENEDVHKDLDYPWVGETYVLNGKPYTVVDLNHPDNPKGSRISAYRNYGRMGFFPKAVIPAGKSLTFKYRFLIGEGPLPEAEVIQKNWDEYVGAASPTPAPKSTKKAAEQPAPAKPKGT
jgi:hypothetical protein